MDDVHTKSSFQRRFKRVISGAGIVTALMLTSGVLARPIAERVGIDFERLPGQAPPIAEGTNISTQYRATHGVSFSIVGSTTLFPVIAVTGNPRVGFFSGSGAGTVNDGPMTDGLAGLTDPDDGAAHDIAMDFDPPVTSIQLNVIDIDGSESVTVRAFNGATEIASTSAIGGGNGTGDGVSTPFSFTAPVITRVVIDVSASIGFAVDGISFSRSWIQFPGNGHWYKAEWTGGNNIGANWAEAEAAARAQGGYLATVTSDAEDAFVFSLLNYPKLWRNITNNSAGPWIGGFQTPDSCEPGCGWGWVTGEAWSFTKWGAAEPNNINGTPEDRVCYWSNTPAQQHDQWNDWGGYNPTCGYVVEVDCLGVTQPASTCAQFGGTAVFAITAGGDGPISYRWEREGAIPGVFSPLVDGSTPGGPIVSGPTTGALTIAVLSCTDAGRIRCVASNACVSVTTAAAWLRTPISIADARALGAGQLVILRDVRVANRTDLVASTGSMSLTIEDDTGALTVFGDNAEIQPILNATATGGNVLTTICGLTLSYQGVFELQAPSLVVAAGRTEAAPRFVVHTSDFVPQSPTAEALESHLVMIDGMQFTQGGRFASTTSYVLPSGITVWLSTPAIADDLNARFGGIPTGRTCRLLGVFSQFDQVAPFDADYQLYLTDLIPECDGSEVIVNSVLDAIACPIGGAATFSATAGPSLRGPYYFQWQAETTPGVFANLANGATGSGSTIAGAGTPAMTISGVSSVDTARTYRVVATSACGAAPSNTASINTCAADFNCSGAVTLQDLFGFLAVWFASDLHADFNNSMTVTVQDIFDFLAAYFAGCA